MATPTYFSVATTTLGADTSTVTFSSIPATYGDLIIIYNGTNTSSTEADIIYQFNGDTAANYAREYFTGDGTSVSWNKITSGQTGYFALQSSSTQTVGVTQIFDYAQTDRYKFMVARGNLTAGRVSLSQGRWLSNSAINSITFSGPTFTAGSTFTIYGVNV